MTFNARTVSLILAVATFAVMIAGAGSLMLRILGYEFGMGLVPIFDLDAENNIPTYYSSILLLTASMLLGLVAQASSERFRNHWRGLAIIFFLLSLDEMASLHELVGYHIQTRFEPSGLLYFGWVVPAAIFVGIVGIVYTKFLLRLPRIYAVLFVVAGTIYVGGALGIEAFSGAESELNGVDGNIRYHALAFVEECFELMGATLFAGTLAFFFERNCLPFSVASPVRIEGRPKVGRLT